MIGLKDGLKMKQTENQKCETLRAILTQYWQAYLKIKSTSDDEYYYSKFITAYYICGKLGYTAICQDDNTWVVRNYN